MELICVKGVVISGLVKDDGLSINKELCVLEGIDRCFMFFMLRRI